MNINFREIDKSNYSTCISLKVGEHQTNYVASNAFSLVQAFYEEKLYPLGIYNDNEMVGFLLYDYDEELGGWSFSRFMIDIKHQNKGIGSKALEKFLDFFHNKFPNENLYTSVEIDNEIIGGIVLSRLIRYANLDDSGVLGKIHSKSSQAGFKDIIPDDILNDVFSIERRTKRFISELSIGSPKSAIIFEEDEPLGFISFGSCRYGNNDKSWIEIWRLYVIREFWGSSVSKELIEWGINEIIKENFKNIELWVLEKNIRARCFYEKMGFKYDNTYQIIESGKELRYIKVKDM